MHRQILSLFCAGTYPVLTLVNSRTFGLELLSCGLLSSELRELSKIKLRSTIYFENAPQLVIQVLFTALPIQSDGIQMATVLAFVASLLSVLAAVLIDRAEKNNRNEYESTKYFVRLQTPFSRRRLGMMYI